MTGNCNPGKGDTVSNRHMMSQQRERRVVGRVEIKPPERPPEPPPKEPEKAKKTKKKKKR